MTHLHGGKYILCFLGGLEPDIGSFAFLLGAARLVGPPMATIEDVGAVSKTERGPEPLAGAAAPSRIVGVSMSSRCDMDQLMGNTFLVTCRGSRASRLKLSKFSPGASGTSI
jgi:hypothetical protein